VTVTTSVREGVLDVEVRGIGSHLMVFSGDHHIPIADIVEARVVGWDEARAGLGWRTGGGYWPGWFATGWFTLRGRKGARQFLSVYRDRDGLLLVDTRVERPARLVLAVPNPHGLADEINRQLAVRSNGG
jgi:hypothetical protein